MTAVAHFQIYIIISRFVSLQPPIPLLAPHITPTAAAAAAAVVPAACLSRLLPPYTPCCFTRVFTHGPYIRRAGDRPAGPGRDKKKRGAQDDNSGIPVTIIIIKIIISRRCSYSYYAYTGAVSTVYTNDNTPTCICYVFPPPPLPVSVAPICTTFHDRHRSTHEPNTVTVK